MPCILNFSIHPFQLAVLSEDVAMGSVNNNINLLFLGLLDGKTLRGMAA